MAFFTSLFRNLKEGGEVKSQFWQLFEKANKPLTAPLYRKEGGAVSGKKLFNLTPEMVNTMYGKPLATRNIIKPVPKKKGGAVKPPGVKHQSGSRAGKNKKQKK